MARSPGIQGFIKKLSGREKIVFFTAVIVISITLIDRLVIDPIFAKIDELNTNIEAAESDIKRSMRIIGHKDKILAENQSYSSFIDSFTSEEEEMTAILKEVESVANISSIYLIDMKPRGLKESGTSLKYLVRLSCEAQMEQIIDFMYRVENSKRLLTIEQYEISPKSKESSIAVCTITISKLVISDKFKGEPQPEVAE